MSGILRWLDDWAEEFCVSVMLALLVLLLGMEVFSRFLLGKSFSWMEELCRYLFVWSSYIGVAIAVKHKEQLRILMLMDLLEKRFPRLVKACYIVSELSFAGFCILVFYYSVGMLENMTRFKQVSASLEINVMYAYLIIPISMALTIFRVLQGLLRDIRNRTLADIDAAPRTTGNQEGITLLRQTIEALYPPEFADAANNGIAREATVEQAGEWVANLVERWR